MQQVRVHKIDRRSILVGQRPPISSDKLLEVLHVFRCFTHTPRPEANTQKRRRTQEKSWGNAVVFIGRRPPQSLRQHSS